MSAASVSVGCRHEFMNVAGFERRMTRIGDHAKLRFRPNSVQIPSAGRRTDDVVAALYDGRGNIPDALHVVQQLTLAAQETAIHEVMAFDARHGEGEEVLAPFPNVILIAVQKAGGRFPYRPCASRCQRYS